MNGIPLPLDTTDLLSKPYMRGFELQNGISRSGGRSVHTYSSKKAMEQKPHEEFVAIVLVWFYIAKLMTKSFHRIGFKFFIIHYFRRIHEYVRSWYRIFFSDIPSSDVLGDNIFRFTTHLYLVFFGGGVNLGLPGTGASVFLVLCRGMNLRLPAI